MTAWTLTKIISFFFTLTTLLTYSYLFTLLIFINSHDGRFWSHKQNEILILGISTCSFLIIESRRL